MPHLHPTPRSAFAGFRFPPEVITLAVRWYRFGLSYRDVEELLAERGIEVDHVSIYRWVQRLAPVSTSSGIVGTSMRPTSRSEGHGDTCSGPSTSSARSSTSSSRLGGTEKPHGGSSPERWARPGSHQ